MSDSKPNLWSGRLDTTRTKLTQATGVLGLLFTAELAIHFAGHFIETFYMGRLGPTYLSGVTLSIVILAIAFSFLVELGTGLTNLVAQNIGANDPTAAGVAVGQAILLCAGICLPISILGVLLAPELLALMGAASPVVNAGAPYLSLGFVAMFILVLPLVLNAALRALGNAAIAASLEVLQLVLLFVLTPILVLGFGPIPRLEALGAMAALVISRLAATILQLGFFFSGRLVVRLRLNSLQPHMQIMRRMVTLSLPSTGQQLLRFGTEAAIVRLVASFGTAAIAGFSLSLLFLRLLETIGHGVGNAVFTVVGQNLGAGQGRRALRGTWIGVGYSLAVIGVGVIVQIGFAPNFIAIFSADAEVVAIGATAIRVIAGSYVFSAVAYVLTRSFHGTGDTTSPFIVDLIVLWSVQVPLALGLSLGIGWQVNGIWVAIAVANVVRTLMLMGWFRRRAVHQFVLQHVTTN